MSALPFDAINIGSRFRQDHGEIRALARSVADIGLPHANVVDQHGQLLAGRRPGARNDLKPRNFPHRIPPRTGKGGAT